MPDQSNAVQARQADRSPRALSVLGQVAGWIWAVAAGGGGLWMLLTRGPWPLTNGWFALASGLSGCPLTAWVLKKSARVTVSGWIQFALALLFFVAGRIALMLGL